MDKLLALLLICNVCCLQNLFSGIVGYRKVEKANPKVVAHILDFDPSEFTPKLVLGGNCSIGIETVASMVKRSNAIAGFNGGFYKTGLDLGSSIGFLLVDKTPVSNGENARGAIGWNKNSKKTQIDQLVTKIQLYIGNANIILSGFNQELKTKGINLYNHFYSRTTLTPPGTKEYLLTPDKKIRYLGDQGNNDIPRGCYVLSIEKSLPALLNAQLNVNHSISCTVYPQLESEYRPVWNNFDYIIQAGPLLLKNFKECVGINNEKIPSELGKDLQKARTSIGLKNDGRWIVAVIEATATSQTKGLTLKELANFMKTLGCKDAVNLDGGGSSTIVYEGKKYFSPSTVIHPFEHKNVIYMPVEGDRPVGNGIVITKKG